MKQHLSSMRLEKLKVCINGMTPTKLNPNDNGTAPLSARHSLAIYRTIYILPVGDLLFFNSNMKLHNVCSRTYNVLTCCISIL